MANTKLSFTKIHLNDLDILRGLAAVLMITNHLGNTALTIEQHSQGITGSLVFVGSFAPVLFFFITGVGYGVQSEHKKSSARWLAVINKVAILLLADLLMQWSRGRFIGLDFLGFIGLSVLLLEVVRKLRNPLIFCTAGIFSVALLRYAVGPLTRSVGYNQQSLLINWVLGTTEVPNVSYPLSPWITYPLLGYIVGVAVVRYWGYLEKHRLLVAAQLAAIASLPTIASFILLYRGISFFRWGTVGLGFYIASFAVVLLGLALSLVICSNLKFKPCQTALSLKGVASLAVVPIHYFLIESVIKMGGNNLSLLSFYVVLLLALTTSFFLANTVERISRKVQKIRYQQYLWSYLVVVVLLMSGITFAYGRGGSEFLAMLPRTVGQVSLCLLLSVQNPLHQRFKLTT